MRNMSAGEAGAGTGAVFGNAGQIAHLADYMIAWGAYVFFNLLMSMLLGRGFWAETVFLPPIYVMSRLIGVVKSIAVWVWGYAIMYGVFLLTGNTGITIVATVLAFVILTFISYSFVKRSGEHEQGIAISPYIGISWGILWASTWLILSMFSSIGENSALWFIYTAGAGLLITGILHRVFLILGLYTLFVIPIVIKFFPHMYAIAYAVVGLGMMIAGYSMRKQAEKF